MPAARVAPIIGAMTKDRREDGRSPLARAAGTVALIVLVAVTLRFVPLPAVDLPAIPFPDLPDWAGPVFRRVRWGVLAILVVLVIVGAVEDERREREREEGS